MQTGQDEYDIEFDIPLEDDSFYAYYDWHLYWCGGAIGYYHTHRFKIELRTSASVGTEYYEILNIPESNLNIMSNTCGAELGDVNGVNGANCVDLQELYDCLFIYENCEDVLNNYCAADFNGDGTVQANPDFTSLFNWLLDQDCVIDQGD